MILPLCPLCEAFCLFGKWLCYPAAIPTISIDIGAPYLNLWGELTRVVPRKLTPTEPRTVHIVFQWVSKGVLIWFVVSKMHCLPPWHWDSEIIWRSCGIGFLTTSHNHLMLVCHSGWWFGTMEFYDFPDIGNYHPNWRTPSFFRGVGQPPTSTCHIIHCMSSHSSNPLPLRENVYQKSLV